MNAATACVTICAEKLKECEYIDWDILNSLAETMIQVDPEQGKSLQIIFSEIHKKYDQEMDTAKTIIESKSNALDIAIAKLQIMEEKEYFQKSQEPSKEEVKEDEEIDSNDKEDTSFNFGDNQIIIEGEIEEEDSDEDVFIFDAVDSDSTLTKLEDSYCKGKNPLSICSGIVIHKPFVNQTRMVKKLMKDIEICREEVNNLRRQNNQYLSLGLDWKRKYRQQSQDMQKMMEDHYSEIRRLVALLPSNVKTSYNNIQNRNNFNNN